MSDVVPAAGTVTTNPTISFAEGATLSAPVIKRRGSKYDQLLDAVLVRVLDTEAGEWVPYTIAEGLGAAENAALHVRRLGRDEGAGDWHLRARAQADPQNEAQAILFVMKVDGAAPTRTKKAGSDDAGPDTTTT